MTLTDILFDLDGTIYPLSNGLDAALVGRMSAFIQQALDLDSIEAARQLVAELHQRHGLTVCGLREEYNIDPEEFEAFVQGFDYSTFLKPSPPLARRLETIPLRKSIFTNAPASHANRVLALLGVNHYFGQIFDLEFSGWCPKPNPATYERVLDSLGCNPKATVMIEDSARNLVPARSLGITTIWISQLDAVPPPDVDYVVPGLDAALDIIAAL